MGRKRHPVRDYFKETDDKKLVCRGCKKFVVPEETRLVILQTHFSTCANLQKLVHKDSERSDEKGQSESSRDGSVLKWIVESTDRSSRQRFGEAWVSFALSSNLGLHALSKEDFVFAAELTQEIGGVHAIGGGAAVQAIVRLKKQVRIQIKAEATGQFVSLVLDGWSVNYKKEHAHAFLFADWNNRIVFHSLEGDLLSHTAEYMTEKILKVCAQIEKDYGATVCGVVADNASVMDKALRSVKEERPLIAHHCAAHWFQLVLKDLSSCDKFVQATDVATNILTFFSKKQNLLVLRKICNALNKKSQALVHPCATRWNTSIDVMVRVLDMQEEITLACADCRLEDPLVLESKDFDVMLNVCKCLIPIAVATDEVQRNDWGALQELRTVRKMKCDLQEVKRKIADQSFIDDVLDTLDQRLQKTNWEENVEIQNVALFLTVRPSVLDENEPATSESAKEFLLTQGVLMLKRYCMKDETLEDIKARVEKQLAEYIEQDIGGPLNDLVMTETIKRWKLALVGRFSLLAKLARMIFSVRASEAAAERLFSLASYRMGARRNRLTIEKLSDELFVQFNKKQFKTKDTKVRKKRKLVEYQSEIQDGCTDDDEGVQAVAAGGLREEFIETICLPFFPERSNEDVDISYITKCTNCGVLFEREGYPTSVDGPSDMFWWCCRSCMKPFCCLCQEHELNDATGLCYHCATPELDVLRKIRSRKE